MASSLSSTTWGSLVTFSSLSKDYFTFSTNRQQSTDPPPDQVASLFPNQDHTKTLLVRSLGPDLCPKYIRELFLVYGSIKSLRVLWKRDEQNEQDTIAFIEFEDQRSAEKAVSEIDQIMKKVRETKERKKENENSTKEKKKNAQASKVKKSLNVAVFIGHSRDRDLTEKDFRTFGRLEKGFIKQDETDEDESTFVPLGIVLVIYVDESY